MKILPMNEETLLVSFGTEISEEIHYQMKSMVSVLETIEGVISIVPSYTDLAVTYTMSYEALVKIIEAVDVKSIEAKEKKVIEIPVCYEMGLDIERVAELNGLSVEEVIKKHSEKAYLVYMMGFVPGFPYLGGLDESLHTPRLDQPRTKIPAGSVGIGGKQTGIYPLETPGGWNIIGRTPFKLFDSKDTLIHMGEYVKFKPISKKAYERMCEYGGI